MDFHNFANVLTVRLNAIRIADPRLSYSLLKVGNTKIRLQPTNQPEQRKVLVLIPLFTLDKNLPSPNFSPLRINKPCPSRVFRFQDENSEKYIYTLTAFIPLEEKSAVTCLRLLITEAKRILKGELY